MYTSEVTKLNAVQFPKFTGEKLYMIPIFKNKKLENKHKRWQKTVDDMLKDIHHDGEMFLMVDQGEIASGNSHRRGGKHIDGYWLKDLSCHGGGNGGHIHARDTGSGRWNSTSFNKDEAILLASDVSGCSAYAGEWEGMIGEGGDCENINVSGMDVIKLKAGVAYVGNVTMIHESTALQVDCSRTLVRINIPDYYH